MEGLYGRIKMQCMWISGECGRFILSELRKSNSATEAGRDGYTGTITTGFGSNRTDIRSYAGGNRADSCSHTGDNRAGTCSRDYGDNRSSTADI